MFDRKKNNKYGVIKYSSINIGDEIQSVAAMRFLPRIDYYVHRERIDEFSSQNNEKVKVIMNAWWMWNSAHFPPSDCIDPLFVSFHLREAIRNKFFTDDVKKYLKKYEPIGCRDTNTVECMKENGIDAYYTGCMTSTLLPNLTLKDKFDGGQYILCVDVPDVMVEAIKKRAEKKVYSITRMLSPAFTSINRFKVAKFMLFIYHNAACVVTPRLHSSLPAIAMQTPVCMLKSDNLPRNGRFDGLDGLFNEVELEKYILDPKLYDINDPPKNPDMYLEISEGLCRKCSEFTGFDSKASVFEDDYNPILEMIQLLAYDKNVIKRQAMFLDEKELVTILNEKVVKKQTKHDLTY